MSELVTVYRKYLDHQTESTIKVVKDNIEILSIVGLELPNRHNAGTHDFRTSGCIPEGTYNCTNHHLSPSRGLCISINNVPGRKNILIHKCNWVFELLGCLGVGMTHADIPKLGAGGKVIYAKDGDLDNISSGVALDKLMKILPNTFQIKFTS